MKAAITGRVEILDLVKEGLDAQGASVEASDFLAYWFEKDAAPDAEVIGWMQNYPARHVIGTNNETRRASFIETEMGFAAMVERVFASGRLGVAKPDQEFFEQIEDWAGVAPERILFVDDLQKNTDAASLRGWTGFHFTPATRAALPELLGIQMA